jgi:hypothetical protein
MSKKRKKADSESPAQIESQEVGNTEQQAPATIVESSEEQLFADQEAEEKPAPKPRISKRPYIAGVEILLNAGTHTKKELLAFILEKYPAVSKGGASTFLTDLMNEKYRRWKDRAVTKTQEGKLQFADRIEAPEPEAQPTNEGGEQPAE